MRHLIYNIYRLLALSIVLLLAGCAKDEMEITSQDEEVVVTYTARISDIQFETKALGDGSKVNRLYYALYEKNGSEVVYGGDMAISTTQSVSLQVPMFKHKEYDLILWAQSSTAGIYDIENLKEIKIRTGVRNFDAEDYTDIENFDAFYAGKAGINYKDAQTTITLNRPFAQVNLGVAQEILDNAKNAGYEVGKAVVTIENIADCFNPLTGSAYQCGVNTDNHTQKFKFKKILDNQKITVEKNGVTEEYLFLATAYLFPTNNKVSGSLEVFAKNQTEAFSTKTFSNIYAGANEVTNIYGSSLINIPVNVNKWDGETYKAPEYNDVAQCYFIDEPSQLAYLIENLSSLNQSSTFVLTEDMDMDYKMDPIQLPAGYSITLKGSGKKIIHLSNSLFGDVTNTTATPLVISNVVIENVEITASQSVTHVGTLVNTLKGNAEFRDVTIRNSSVTTTNGAAGGIVGYIRRNNDIPAAPTAAEQQTIRGEKYTVLFENCTIENTTVAGSQSEGKVVGLFSGYDNGEVLIFKNDTPASVATTITDYTPKYTNANRACFLTDAVYGTSYDGWLGDEEYCRGSIYFGYDDVEAEKKNRYIRRWDGVTEVEPIYEDPSAKKIAEIHSPFDLASLQGATKLTTLKFYSDIDMSGVCPDCQNGKGNSTIANDDLSTCTHCKPFKPIVSLNNLYGNNKTLYNLFVQGVHILESDNYGMGFICYTNAGTFENFTFDGAIIKCIDIKELRSDDQNGGNAYAGTLTSKSKGKMTIKNVHAKNGHIIGVSKIGGLIGSVTGGIDANGCTVDNYIIENHRINVINSYEENITKSIKVWILTINLKAECRETFYTEGEAGGLIGFIISDAKIANCHTSRITMKCYGQDNKTTPIKCYVSGLHVLNIDYTIAGRHVNTFIGDIRTPSNNIITINECSASGQCADGYDYDITHQGKGELVGCCYFVGKDLKFSDYEMHAGDYKGSVTIDGESMDGYFIGG